jgi:hypothetical protein
MTMSSDSKETKAAPAPKSGTEAKTASTPAKETAKTEAKTESAPAKETAKTEAKTASAPAKETAKTEGGDAAAAVPSNYSRGEGQKPVTAAYKENWNAIFGKKKAKKKKR